MGQYEMAAEIHTQHHRQAAATSVLICLLSPNPRPALSDHSRIDGGILSVWGFFLLVSSWQHKKGTDF